MDSGSHPVPWQGASDYWAWNTSLIWAFDLGRRGRSNVTFPERLHQSMKTAMADDVEESEQRKLPCSVSSSVGLGLPASPLIVGSLRVYHG